MSYDVLQLGGSWEKSLILVFPFWGGSCMLFHDSLGNLLLELSVPEMAGLGVFLMFHPLFLVLVWPSEVLQTGLEDCSDAPPLVDEYTGHGCPRQ